MSSKCEKHKCSWSAAIEQSFLKMGRYSFSNELLMSTSYFVAVVTTPDAEHKDAFRQADIYSLQNVLAKLKASQHPNK